MVMNLRKLMLLNLLHYLDTFRSLDTDIEAQLGKLLCCLDIRVAQSILIVSEALVMRERAGA